MEKLYQFEGLCLWDRGGGLPEGAAPCSAPFAPLVITVRRDPAKSRGLYRIDDLRRLDAQDVRAALQPLPPQQAAVIKPSPSISVTVNATWSMCASSNTV